VGCFWNEILIKVDEFGSRADGAVQQFIFRNFAFAATTGPIFS
jgi:hypothetical protein